MQDKLQPKLTCAASQRASVVMHIPQFLVNTQQTSGRHFSACSGGLVWKSADKHQK